MCFRYKLKLKLKSDKCSSRIWKSSSVKLVWSGLKSDLESSDIVKLQFYYCLEFALDVATSTPMNEREWKIGGAF